LTSSPKAATELAPSSGALGQNPENLGMELELELELENVGLNKQML